MDPLHCTRCARPFTAGEVTGLGILRSRLESQGGPIMDFACPACGQRMRLIPHGLGRYAFPGHPPPPPVPEADRVPPWVRPDRAGPPPRPDPTGPATPDPEPPEPPVVEIHPPEDALEEPLTLPAALAILGVGPEAGREEIERAFRERSRTCHPDKVAHLDPDFQALAEQKFKRLRSAYELLLS